MGSVTDSRSIVAPYTKALRIFQLVCRRCEPRKGELPVKVLVAPSVGRSLGEAAVAANTRK